MMVDILSAYRWSYSLSSQAVPRYKITWNGDVWKAIVDLRQQDDIEIFTCVAINKF